MAKMPMEYEEGNPEYKFVSLSKTGSNYTANTRNTTNFATEITNSTPSGYTFSHLISEGAYGSGVVATTYVDLTNSPKVIYVIPATSGSVTVYGIAVYKRSDIS